MRPTASLSSLRIPATPARHGVPADASWLLALVGFLLFVVPPRYAVGTSGLSFNSTTLLGLVALFTWVSIRVFQMHRVSRRFNPARWAVFLYASYAVLSLAVAQARPLTSVEQNGSLRTLAITLGTVGLALIMCDGVRTEHGIRRVLTWTLLGAYSSALIAIGQRLFGLRYVSWWSNLPMLRSRADGAAIEPLLDGRATGTANHPIELSVVCACLLALAAHHAVHATGRMRMVHGSGAGLLLVACLLAVSRSGFIAVIIVGLATVVALPLRHRVNALGFVVACMAAVQLLGQGALSRLRYQMLHIGTDASTQGRTADYGPVFEMVRDHPWLGLGLGTFDPRQYFYLDNSWLGTLLTGGVVGVLVLLVLLLCTMYTAGLARRAHEAGYLSGVARACGVALFGFAVSAYFFDELAFSQSSTMVFLLVGTIASVFALSESADHRLGSGFPVPRPARAETRTTGDPSPVSS